VCVLEQLGKLLAALGALPTTFTVDVFVRDGVTGVGAPLPQLPRLVSGSWALSSVLTRA
jgi:hypothetical protein